MNRRKRILSNSSSDEEFQLSKKACIDLKMSKEDIGKYLDDHAPECSDTDDDGKTSESSRTSNHSPKISPNYQNNNIGSNYKSKKDILQKGNDFLDRELPLPTRCTSGDKHNKENLSSKSKSMNGKSHVWTDTSDSDSDIPLSSIKSVNTKISKKKVQKSKRFSKSSNLSLINQNSASDSDPSSLVRLDKIKVNKSGEKLLLKKKEKSGLKCGSFDSSSDEELMPKKSSISSFEEELHSRKKVKGILRKESNVGTIPSSSSGSENESIVEHKPRINMKNIVQTNVKAVNQSNHIASSEETLQFSDLKLHGTSLKKKYVESSDNDNQNNDIKSNSASDSDQNNDIKSNSASDSDQNNDIKSNSASDSDQNNDIKSNSASDSDQNNDIKSNSASDSDQKESSAMRSSREHYQSSCTEDDHSDDHIDTSIKNKQNVLKDPVITSNVSDSQSRKTVIHKKEQVPESDSDEPLKLKNSKPEFADSQDILPKKEVGDQKSNMNHTKTVTTKFSSNPSSSEEKVKCENESSDTDEDSDKPLSLSIKAMKNKPMSTSFTKPNNDMYVYSEISSCDEKRITDKFEHEKRNPSHDSDDKISLLSSKRIKKKKKQVSESDSDLPLSNKIMKSEHTAFSSTKPNNKIYAYSEISSSDEKSVADNEHEKVYPSTDSDDEMSSKKSIENEKKPVNESDSDEPLTKLKKSVPKLPNNQHILLKKKVRTKKNNMNPTNPGISEKKVKCKHVSSDTDEALSSKVMKSEHMSSSINKSNEDTSDSSEVSSSEEEANNFRHRKGKSPRSYVGKKDPLAGYKHYLRAMGIRIKNYGKLFEKSESIIAKKEKLRNVMKDNGLKGRPSREKCKKLKKKLEMKQEVEVLDLGNIISETGRGKRRVQSLYATKSPIKSRLKDPISNSPARPSCVSVLSSESD